MAMPIRWDISLTDASRIKKIILTDNGPWVLAFDLTSGGRNVTKKKIRYWLFKGESLKLGLRINISGAEARELLVLGGDSFVRHVEPMFEARVIA